MCTPSQVAVRQLLSLIVSSKSRFAVVVTVGLAKIGPPADVASATVVLSHGAASLG